MNELPTDLIGRMIYLLTEFSDFYILGIKITLIIALLGTVFGTLLGAVLAIVRNIEVGQNDKTLNKIVKIICKRVVIFYIDFIRGTPMMVQAVIFYYGVTSKFMDPLYAGIIIVSFNSAAYIAEILRSGINGISTGQMEAARSLGLTRFQAMKKIVIPQALNNSIPALMNELIVNIKDSSVLSVIGITDLFYMSKNAASKYYWNVESFILAAIIYFILTTILSKTFERILKKRQNKVTLPQSQTVNEVIS